MLKLFCIVHESTLGRVVEQLQRLACVQLFDVKEHFRFLKPLETGEEEVLSLEERISDLLSDLKPEVRKRLAERLLGPKAVPVEIVERMLSLKEIEREVNRVEGEYLEYCGRLTEIQKELRGIEEELRRIEAEAVDIEALPEEAQIRGQLLGRREALLRRLSEVEGELALFKKRSYSHLLALKEALENLKIRARALEKFGRLRSVVLFAGWVPEKCAERVESAIEAGAGGLAVLKFYPPKREDSPPILLENPRIIKPYEVLTTTYGLPEYDGVDPTPILAITFTAMFGMMFADVGYGLALSILSLILYLLTTRRERVIKDINLIVFYAGTASMFFGLLAGEFFGGLLELKPLLSGYLQNLQLLLLISFLLGFTHISISLLSRIASKKDVLYSLSLLLVLWGSALYISHMPKPAAPLLIAGFAVLIREKGTAVVEELIALAANVVSYARVGALAVIHVTLARLLVGVVESVKDGFLGIVLAALLFVLGAAFILASSTFIVFIQSLRLHWLEFFRRFYSGRGEMFKPLAYKGEYTYLL